MEPCRNVGIFLPDDMTLYPVPQFHNTVTPTVTTTTASVLEQLCTPRYGVYGSTVNAKVYGSILNGSYCIKVCYNIRT
jgi:hypothetical protein